MYSGTDTKGATGKNAPRRCPVAPTLHEIRSDVTASDFADRIHSPNCPSVVVACVMSDQW